MATATNAQKIAGLYAAFFERAPDAAGLSYWEGQFTGNATVNTIAVQFAANPVFAATYGSLTDVQFVNAVYQNVLGAAGDAAGVDYWVSQLKTGGADARANFVAQFVNDALTVDVASFTNLTAEERAVAQGRQDTLTNKANVGLHFAEKFGAASNITATGDITKDPAYLAAQAAIKNVTADKATAEAAEGRIDIAVGTSDPVGSLVGQNSALTAALVDLQTKTVAEDAALEALAVAANATAETPFTGDDLTKFIKDFKADDTKVVGAVVDATSALANAKVAAANAEKTLVDERTAESDAALNAKVTAALNAVNGNTVAKDLLATANSTKAAVAASSDAAVLGSVKDALTAFIAAGGKTSVSLSATADVGKVLDDVNALLNLKVGDDNGGSPHTAKSILDAQKDGVEAFATADYSLTPVKADAPTASETGVINAITAVETRDAAYTKESDAETALTKDPLGLTLRNAQAEVTGREAQIKAVADANANVTKEQADLTKVQAAFDAHATAADKLAAADKTITDLGYHAGSLTGDKDVLVADITKIGDAAKVSYVGFATGDELFIGTQYKFGGVAETSKLGDLYQAGNASALEVFFEQSGTNTIVHIESKAFSNAGALPANDVASIELTGVAANTLTFENGFVHVA